MIIAYIYNAILEMLEKRKANNIINKKEKEKKKREKALEKLYEELYINETALEYYRKKGIEPTDNISCARAYAKNEIINMKINELEENVYE